MPDKDVRTDLRAAAHDLNNLLTIILNSADLLKKKSEDPEILKAVSNINLSARLAGELLEESFISPASPKRLKFINLNGIISEAAVSVGQKYASKLTISLSLQENLKLIKARYSDCYRILMNLIINSAEAISENGRIDIWSENISNGEGNSFVEISVKDNGCGIPEENLNKIFDKGFSTKQKSGISGIGLSLVKEIVESFGGRISIKSIHGEGTEFILLLPAVSETESPPGANKSILIAEDEHVLRELLGDLLESYDYSVEKCADGLEVISKTEHGKKFDLMIIDKKMPGMDGFECIRRLRASGINVPVILASGSREEDEAVIRELGIAKIVNKPYNFDDMFLTIRGLIA